VNLTQNNLAGNRANRNGKNLARNKARENKNNANKKKKPNPQI
jgi:hypothetical protein